MARREREVGPTRAGHCRVRPVGAHRRRLAVPVLRSLPGRPGRWSAASPSTRTSATGTGREVFQQAGQRRSAGTRRRARPGSTSHGRRTQEGLAVRIRDRRWAGPGDDADQERRASSIDWVFNLVTWDTDRRGDPWRDVESVRHGRRGGRPEPTTSRRCPWRVCLRATGRHVAFKVWRSATRARTVVARPRRTPATHRLPRPFRASARRAGTSATLRRAAGKVRLGTSSRRPTIAAP